MHSCSTGGHKPGRTWGGKSLLRMSAHRSTILRTLCPNALRGQKNATYATLCLSPRCGLEPCPGYPVTESHVHGEPHWQRCAPAPGNPPDPTPFGHSLCLSCSPGQAEPQGHPGSQPNARLLSSGGKHQPPESWEAKLGSLEEGKGTQAAKPGVRFRARQPGCFQAPALHGKHERHSGRARDRGGAFSFHAPASGAGIPRTSMSYCCSE